VTRLAEAIESGGKQVWIDTAGIEDTEVFPLAIRSAIETSDAFLFVISPASVASRFCEQEVDYAVSLHKRLVPVLRARVSDEELPEPIRERSWIPFETDAEFAGSLSRVLSALDTDLEHRRSHTLWLTKAIEWDQQGRDKSLLLRGGELRAGETWLGGTTGQSDPAPTTLQRELLLASRQAAARRGRLLVTGSLAVTLLAVGLVVFALISRSQAVQDQHVAVREQVAATAQALAVESQNDLTVDPEASVILATRAVEDDATPETMLALREALDASPLLASLPTVAAPMLCNGPATPAVAFRPGTDQIAENACAQGIILANASTGKTIRQLSPIASGTDISYNPRGTLLAVGTLFGVSLLNPESGVVEKVLLSAGSVPGTSTAGSITFNPSGSTVGVAADGLGGQSELLEVKSGRETVLGGTNPQSLEYGLATNNSSLSFTSDNRFVIAAPGSGGVTPVFDTATGALVRTLKTGPPSLVGFPTLADTSRNPKVPLLAVAVNTDLGNGRVEIWNTRTWREEFVLTTTSDVQYRSLAFSPDGNELAVAEANGSSAVWSIPARRQIVPLLGQTAGIDTIVFSSDGSEVATSSDDGTCRVWRASGPERYDLDLDGRIESVGLTARQAVVASLHDERQEGASVEKVQVSVWSLPLAQEVSHFVIAGSSPYDVVSVSPDGRYVADFADTPNGTCGSAPVLCPSGLVIVYSVATRSVLRSYPVAGAEDISWNGDDEEIAVATEGLEVVSLNTGLAAALSVTNAESCGVDRAPAFSAQGSLVAWATGCGNVAVFRLSGGATGAPVGEPVTTFLAPGESPDIAFNPVATQLAVTSSSGAVTVFNPLTGKREFSLPSAASGVTSVAYSPDGRYLVTTLLDGSVEVWSSDGPLQGQLLRVDREGGALLTAPAFEAGGDFATGDADGTVEIWQECPACGDSSALLRLGRSHVVSQLTPLEHLAKA
jgi:WD40 repeat protein